MELMYYWGNIRKQVSCKIVIVLRNKTGLDVENGVGVEATSGTGTGEGSL